MSCETSCVEECGSYRNQTVRWTLGGGVSPGWDAPCGRARSAQECAGRGQSGGLERKSVAPHTGASMASARGSDTKVRRLWRSIPDHVAHGAAGGWRVGRGLYAGQGLRQLDVLRPGDHESQRREEVRRLMCRVLQRDGTPRAVGHHRRVADRERELGGLMVVPADLAGNVVPDDLGGPDRFAGDDRVLHGPNRSRNPTPQGR